MEILYLATQRCVDLVLECEQSLLFQMIIFLLQIVFMRFTCTLHLE